MKKIGLYLYDLRHSFVGLSEVEKALAERIARRAEELSQMGLEFYFMVPPSWNGRFGDRVRYVALNKWKIFLAKRAFFAPLVRLVMPRLHLVHLCQQEPKLRVRISRFTLLTVHDLNFLYRYRPGRRYDRNLQAYKWNIQRASHLSFISRFTMEDANRIFSISQPQRIIYNGISGPSGPVPDHVDARIPDHYLLHLSGMAPNKNVELLVRMMQYLPGEQLVLAGAAQRKVFSDRIFQLIAELGLSNVHVLGSVDSDTKWALYKNCKAFLFPSLCEGFGLPVGEAMLFGKPVFPSRLTSLPEIGGDSAYYFDELEPLKMAQDLLAGLHDFEQHRDAKAQQIKEAVSRFSWDTAVDQYIAYYLDILASED